MEERTNKTLDELNENLKLKLAEAEKEKKNSEKKVAQVRATRHDD